MNMQLNLLQLRHGKFDDGRQWAKMTAHTDEVNNETGKLGFEVAKFSIPSERVQQVVNSCLGKIPCKAMANVQFTVQQDKPVMTISDIKIA